MAGGRPTKLTQELVDQAQAYVEETQSVGIQTLLPTIEGLALKLKVRRETIHAWANQGDPKDDGETDPDPIYVEFSNIVSDLRAAQGQKLIQNSILGRYNPTIAKLILSGKHNYVEKSEVDNNIKGDVTFVNDVPRPKND